MTNNKQQTEIKTKRVETDQAYLNRIQMQLEIMKAERGIGNLDDYFKKQIKTEVNNANRN